MEQDYINEEIWKPIKNLPEYFCSSFGRFSRNNKILKFSTTDRGYHHIRLYRDGKQYTFRSHRLVYMTFVGNIPENMEINHINGIKTDNFVSNLELTTHTENIRHAIKNGLLVFKQGKDHKLSVPIIATHLFTGEVLHFAGQTEAKRMGFNQGNIQSVLKGKRNSHKNYFWQYA